MTKRTAFVALLLALCAANAQALQTTAISGLVVDAQTLEPLRDVLVRVQASGQSAITQLDGRFRITGVAPGTQLLAFVHIAFGEHTQSVTASADSELRLEVRLSRQAVELAPLRVDALSDNQRQRLASGTRINEILRDEIDEAARRGLDLAELMRQGMPGIRIRGGDRGYCVEYRGAGGFQPGCRQVAVYLDGVKVSSPALLLPTMPIRDIERLELLSPGEAGARYGNDAALGVLLIESRSGVRPERDIVRRPVMPGFDWSMESRPYAWLRVAGSAALANAAGVGLGLVMAEWCLRVDGGFQGLRTDCAAIPTIAAGIASIIVPSAAGSVAARWGGATERSRGRLVPTAMVAATTIAVGYMLVVRGQTEDSGAARTSGIFVLTLGTPIVLTLADRAFRALR